MDAVIHKNLDEEEFVSVVKLGGEISVLNKRKNSQNIKNRKAAALTEVLKYKIPLIN
jgi:hypothetical protein